jgi:mannose-6-phosphate isomerase-like protein (cupin superfamily)
MSQPVIFDADEGEIYGNGASRFRFLAQSPEFAFAITESTVPPHFPGPVLHRHAEMTDIFFVLEGSLQIRLEGSTRTLGPGGFAAVPPGVVHSFANPGDAPTRFLNMYSPSGLEQYVKTVAERAAAGTIATPEEMRQLAMDYDFEPVAEKPTDG